MSGPDSAAVPAHHRPGGGFRIPWPIPSRRPEDGKPAPGEFWRFVWERLRDGSPPATGPGSIPRGAPNIARPAAVPDELRVTWVGHATFLVQTGGLNLLTDPMWSRRASPFRWTGPARFTPPGLPFEELPAIDGVLLSHDHYDHLDHATVRRVARRHPEAVWVTPLGYRRWLRRRGVRHHTELDWWESTALGPADAPVHCTAVPAQHWTRRKPWDGYRRLWAAYAVEPALGPRFFFGGDSGYFTGYQDIGRRLGHFDVVALPIGAYAPRWFMRIAHMNPEEAVQAYADLGGAGAFIAMHWGTFRLSDEPPLEPPERLDAAWRHAGLPEHDLWVPGIGDSRSF